MSWQDTPWRELERESLERRSKEQVSYTLSSMPPLTAIFGVESATILVGLEDDTDGSLKAYLGARYKRTFVRVTEPAEQDAFRRAWGSTSGHIWLSPVPPAELLEQDPPTSGGDA